MRVTRGAILGVAVGLRKSSPSFAEHVSAIVSAEAWNQIDELTEIYVRAERLSYGFSS